MSDAPAIAVERFAFQFGSKPILRDVSFTIAAGESVALIGPNGAGKSTLLKCLDRLQAGGSGTIRIAGRALADYSQRELALRIGYVPQPDGQPPPFGVREFVAMGRYPHQGPLAGESPADRLAVTAALQRTGTLEFAQRRLATLSGGERQKVYIAAALAQEPSILLLDEPTTFLDYRHQVEIRSLLAEIRREAQMTVVTVTHDVASAALDADRILALREGRVVFDGSPGALMRCETLQAIYGTEFLLVAHPHAAFPIVVPRNVRPSS